MTTLADVTLIVTIHDPVQLALSVLIPLVIAVSVWLAGDHNTWSWPLGIAAQVISGIYGVASQDWGWLLSPLVVAPVFARNWVKWRREQRVSPESTDARSLT